jgi:hypothetical protein
MSDQGQGNDDVREAQRELDHFIADLAGISEKYEKELDHFPPDHPERGWLVALIVEWNRLAGWPRPRRVTFVPPDLRAAIPFSVRVVERLTGAPLEVTQDAERKIREVEARNNGNVPLTDEAFAAILSGDEEKVVALAGETSSNLRHFLNWDDAEVPTVARFVRMFGDGN